MINSLTNYLPNGAIFSNSNAVKVHELGTTLTVPIYKILELAQKIIKPLPQCKASAIDLACPIFKKIFYALYLVLLIPLALLGTGIGLSLCAHSNKARSDFVFIKPNDEPTLKEELPSSLKISTFNVAFMPEFIALRNGIRSTKERAVEVTQAIDDRDDDIVCLQEAFDEKATLQMAGSLKKYPYKVMLAGHQTLGLSSGLCILSKYPLKNVTYWKHLVKGGVEKKANKGLIGATVQLTKDKTAFVFTTHLSGGAPYPGGAFYRAEQIEHIRRCMAEYIAKHKPKDSSQLVGTFLTGDFNIGPDEGDDLPSKNPEWSRFKHFFRGEFQEDYSGDGPEYSKKGALQNTSKRGTSFWMRPQDPVTGWDLNQLSNWKIKRECLDHILCHYTTRHRGAKYCRDHMNGSSDHLAIRAEFQIT